MVANRASIDSQLGFASVQLTTKRSIFAPSYLGLDQFLERRKDYMALTSLSDREEVCNKKKYFSTFEKYLNNFSSRPLKAT